MVRQDKQGAHRSAFDKNRKIIIKTQNTCGICGKPVDVSIKAPDPLSPVVDHIIPVSKGGHPSAMDNLQLAHWTCNRQKSDKMFLAKQEAPQVLGNRNLPQSTNWATYKGWESMWKQLKACRRGGVAPSRPLRSPFTPSLYIFSRVKSKGGKKWAKKALII